ncbi:sensor domain-containing diguanylate cyclase [Geomonas sp. Red69]|uniref:Sensor domain-containing diguanylate cyclase n=1 Tax=Geomonas diazotrophica TaxID=2843197 RepID=A0ABX8JLQ2_9BACT|nr:MULTISPECIES: sensor domain-containing diguanylate cyclase [Geomonas]MBU5637585.1 sensor domain-containing diguanylate cyclase [Geomonas diazotrophica]QWV99295.1 sensor domain-containing diguanylate cyclase [Geomonas nitrogeniifigens]QXE88462.1 sensor domain-containing diguanylate cyclase [Geomonas nitrogeniifigens]
MYLSRESYKKIIEDLRDGLYIVDTDRKIIFWNHAAERISGYSAEEVIGKPCADNILCHVDDVGLNLCCSDCPLASTIYEGTPHDAEVFLHHKNGHRVPVSVRVIPLTDDAGTVIGGVEMFSDSSYQADNEVRLKELEKLALLDGLTQLANRRYLDRELESRLEEMNRYDIPFGILFMDLDDFKSVNDCYGHETGDRVLQFVAGTLSANSRPFDLYGRWGGEEFVGIIRNVTPANLKHMGQRLRRLVEKSFVLVEGEALRITISIGATMAVENDTVQTLLARADALMYQSKAAGKNRLTIG